jgi:hypothetical protein
MTTILQAPLLTDFLYPFLLIFFISFGILEKTGVLGSKKTQLNALVALVIGLIFVSAVFPKIIVGNLMLFLSIALVVVFVALLLWGFINGDAKFGDKTKKFLGVVLGIGIVVAVLWASGIGSSGFLVNVWDFLFGSDWSTSFWTNVIFVVLIAGAIAAVLKSGGSSGGGDK